MTPCHPSCHFFARCRSNGHPWRRGAAQAGMSRRTFTRLFRQQLGTSFAVWRQQASLLAALARLGQGEPVTRVALDLGYSSPSAFSAAFRRVLGTTPSQFLQGDPSAD
ncbi:helix-turn-helix domain-containing protein [Neisseriaceae bacterium JH1-16]|nr:helix-turn-helix domain-containing protein [Neisseriaceae bacterium JH1-16]